MRNQVLQNVSDEQLRAEVWRRKVNTEWMSLAKCRGMNPDLFFTTKTGRGAQLEVMAATAVCRQCPVTKRCREFADATGSRDGVWGGQMRRTSV